MTLWCALCKLELKVELIKIKMKEKYIEEGESRLDRLWRP
jgi:hypothetical protein